MEAEEKAEEVGLRIRMTTFENEYFLMIECGNLAALTLCHPKNADTGSATAAVN